MVVDLSSIAYAPAVPMRTRLNCRLAARLATTALVAVAALLPGASRAVDGTWLAGPGSGDFNTAGNWDSFPFVPTGTAFFGASNTIALTFSAGTTNSAGWTFNAGAPNYTFTQAVGQDLFFIGNGIVVNGGSVSITNNGARTIFQASSTAGSANIIINSGSLQFYDNSTAGSATLTANAGGHIEFWSNSSGGTARFILNGSGFVDFSSSVIRRHHRRFDRG